MADLFIHLLNKNMRTEKNKKLMVGNHKKHTNYKIKRLLANKTVSGDAFSSEIGKTYKEIQKLRGNK